MLRLGTRRSELARTQSATVAAALHEHTGAVVELVDVVTHGDVSRASLSTIGGSGVFASALREALLAGEVDLAVHSLKDLPTAPAPGLVLAAVPPREDPRDVLVAAGGVHLADLRPGARVGTGSPRRAAQLLAARPDLQVVDVRGNVGTRLAMVADGSLDAVVLAASGLARLHRAGEVSEFFDPAVMLPAPGQGALAVECRAGDEATLALCAAVDDPRSRAAVSAERTLLAELEAGCTAPIGALATWDAGALHLAAVVASADGRAGVSRSATRVVTADADAGALGREVAADLLAAGAAHLTDGLGGTPTAPLADPGSHLTTRRHSPPPPGHRPPTSFPTELSALITPLHHDPHDTAAAAPPERAHP